jgi:dihydropteroate synthase
LICQIFRISENKVFTDFSNAYKIYREVYDSGLYGLELRYLQSTICDDIFKMVLDENEMCYKKESVDDLYDLFIPGSIGKFKNLVHSAISVANEDAGNKVLSTIKNFEDYDKINYVIGGKEFLFNQAFVMGILNVTPDSFSDGGVYFGREKAVSFGIEMLDAGADILDIGGESTRPGAEFISAGEEMNRVLPVIEDILRARPDAVISIDTSKSSVAGEALKRGALIVNDISGLTYDEEMIETVLKYNATLVIMHIKGTPKDMQEKTEYTDLVKEVFDFLKERTSTAGKAGIQKIIVDPGIGFAKTADQNYELLNRLEDFKCLGYPILTGVSRKSFIGKLLGIEADERDIPSSITDTAAIIKGSKIIRTHNVKFGKYVSTITGKFRRYV